MLYRTTGLDLVLLYNALEAEGLEPGVARLSERLAALGHRVTPFRVSYASLVDLCTLEADFVLDLCDGTGLDGYPGLEIRSILEVRGIPFSGVGSWCAFQASDRHATRQTLAAARVPVPRSVVVPSPDLPIPAVLRYPLYVRPRDARQSTYEGTVVRGPEEAEAVVGLIAEDGGHALVEEYLEGRDLAVGVLGVGEEITVLPPIELELDGGSPAALEPWLASRVRSVALQAYKAIGGDGYARIDLCLVSSGTPYVLDVTTSPSLEDTEVLATGARALGWSHAELLGELIELGLARTPAGARAPYAVAWSGGSTTRALLSFEAGAPVAKLGALYPHAPARFLDASILPTTAGPVFVEPHVRGLQHSTTPNLRVAPDGDDLWLVAARAIAAGEALSLDRTAPLPIAPRHRAPRGPTPLTFRRPPSKAPLSSSERTRRLAR